MAEKPSYESGTVTALVSFESQCRKFTAAKAFDVITFQFSSKVIMGQRGRYFLMLCVDKDQRGPSAIHCEEKLLDMKGSCTGVTELFRITYKVNNLFW